MDRIKRELIGLRNAPRARATRRDDLVASLFGLLTVIGLYTDGWAHIRLGDSKLGPFLTPWHGLLYLGFGLTAAWIGTRN